MMAKEFSLIVIAIQLWSVNCDKKCSTLPQVSARLDSVIKECQEEVRYDIVKEVFEMMRVQQEPVTNAYPDYFENAKTQSEVRRNDENSYQYLNGHIFLSRFKRDTSTDLDLSLEHPTIMSTMDKKIAGCLLKCFFRRSHALDSFGYPTLDGLVHLYTENVTDHKYFMATLKITDFCLKGISYKYRINRRTDHDRGESCNIAFDIFDCISDHIMDYCNEGAAEKQH